MVTPASERERTQGEPIPQFRVRLRLLTPQPFLGQSVTLLAKVTDWQGSPAAGVTLTWGATWGNLRTSSSYGGRLNQSAVTLTQRDGSAKVTLLPPTSEELRDSQQAALQAMLNQLDPDAPTPLAIEATLRHIVAEYRREINDKLRQAIDIYFRDFRQGLLDTINQFNYLVNWSYFDSTVMAYVSDSRTGDTLGVGLITVRFKDWLAPWLEVFLGQTASQDSEMLSNDLNHERLWRETPLGLQEAIFGTVTNYLGLQQGLVGDYIGRKIVADTVQDFTLTGLADFSVAERATIGPALTTLSNTVTIGTPIFNALGQTRGDVFREVERVDVTGKFNDALAGFEAAFDSRLANFQVAFDNRLSGFDATFNARLDIAFEQFDNTFDSRLNTAFSSFDTRFNTRLETAFRDYDTLVTSRLGDFQNTFDSRLNSAFERYDRSFNTRLNTAFSGYDTTFNTRLDSAFDGYDSRFEGRLNDFQTAFDNQQNTFDTGFRTRLETAFKGYDTTFNTRLQAAFKDYDATFNTRLDTSFQEYDSVFDSRLETTFKSYDSTFNTRLDTSFARYDTTFNTRLNTSFRDYDTTFNNRLNTTFDGFNTTFNNRLTTTFQTYDTTFNNRLIGYDTTFNSRLTDTLRNINLGGLRDIGTTPILRPQAAEAEEESASAALSRLEDTLRSKVDAAAFRKFQTQIRKAIKTLQDKLEE